MKSSYKQEEAAIRKLNHDNVKSVEQVKPIKLQFFLQKQEIKTSSHKK